jgi:hypothetical protein
MAQPKEKSRTRKEQKEPKYPRRFWINLALFLVVVTAAWLWFNVHVKPYIGQRWFGGVTIAAVAAFVAGLVKLFIGDDATNELRARMRRPVMTWALVALAPVVAVAHLTTVTVYLRADPSVRPRYVFMVSRGDEKPVRVEITKTNPEHAITRFGKLKLKIATLDPPGYREKTVEATRGVLDVDLPDPLTARSPHLLRLVPGRNFIRRLRDNRRNPHFRLTVSRDGCELFSQRGLKFETIYLGSALHVMEEENAKPEFARQLEEYARTLQTPEEHIPALVARWLNHKAGIEPADDLRNGDRIRVAVEDDQGHATFDQTVDIRSDQKIDTLFFTGPSQ